MVNGVNLTRGLQSSGTRHRSNTSERPSSSRESSRTSSNHGDERCFRVATQASGHGTDDDYDYDGDAVDGDGVDDGEDADYNRPATNYKQSVSLYTHDRSP